MIFAGYTGHKNPVRNRLKIQFVELDFSKLIFRKSSTDQQGVSYLMYTADAFEIWQFNRKLLLPLPTATIKQDFWCPNITLQLKKMTIEMPTPIVDEKWKMKFSFQMNKNNVSLTEKKNLLRMFLVEYKVFKMVDRYLLISFHLVRTGLGQW